MGKRFQALWKRRTLSEGVDVPEINTDARNLIHHQERAIGGYLCCGAADPQEQLKRYQAEFKNPEKLAGIFQVSRPAMVNTIANFFGKKCKR